MAKTRFKGALQTASFPMISVLQTRTVVQPQLDINARAPKSAGGETDTSDFSIPQVLYCENVIPTGEGYQSVGYAPVIQGLNGSTYFDQAITLRNHDENNFLMSPSGGLNYIYTANSGVWESVNPISGAQDKLVTRAYVNGRTFVCYENLGVYEYDATTATFNKQTLSGVADADVRGIGSSSNYLLAFTDLTVHWSSLIDPLDFVPSLSTGAGYSIPQDVKATITAVLGIAGGFIVYTRKNAVAGVYTNNTRAPFTFKEVNNAGGITTYEQVTSEQNAGPHYAWTTGGLQKITVQGSEPVSAEINDFIAGKLWEYWDPLTRTLQQVTGSDTEFAVKISFISSRWLVISYNTTGVAGIYNYALVFDVILKRWGKLKVDHVDCFSYPYPSLFGVITYDDLFNTPYDALNNTSYAQLYSGVASDPPSKFCIGFLSQNGAVRLLEMDYNKTEQQNSVIIFGKFQLTRGRLMTIQQLDIEGIYQDTFTRQPHFEVYAIASIDGYQEDIVIPMRLLKSGNKWAKYAKRLTGMNISIVIIGTFALSTYLLEVTQDGDR